MKKITSAYLDKNQWILDMFSLDEELEKVIVY